jgi:hypothetical protein
LLTWTAHIVILAFAVRAIRRNETRPEGWDVAAAFAVSFFYFLVSYSAMPYFYRAWR